VQPRLLREKLSCNLYVYGSDPDCKSSSKKLEKRLRPAYYQFGKKFVKETKFLFGFIAGGLFLKASLCGLSGPRARLGLCRATPGSQCLIPQSLISQRLHPRSTASRTA
jgi:hypothetical protein